ncbi:hypothetical protein D3C76_641610 [compost metagenome]
MQALEPGLVAHAEIDSPWHGLTLTVFKKIEIVVLIVLLSEYRCQKLETLNALEPVSKLAGITSNIENKNLFRHEAFGRRSQEDLFSECLLKRNQFGENTGDLTSIVRFFELTRHDHLFQTVSFFFWLGFIENKEGVLCHNR